MPLLEPSSYLLEQIFTFLEHFDRGSGPGADGKVAEALYSWGGPLIEQPQRRSLFVYPPPIPFALIKQLHLALSANNAIPRISPPFPTLLTTS